jgi:hypothetical protein
MGIKQQLMQVGGGGAQAYGEMAAALVPARDALPTKMQLLRIAASGLTGGAACCCH